MYILEADPSIIEQEQQKYEDEKKAKMVEHLMSNKQNRGIRIPTFLLPKKEEKPKHNHHHHVQAKKTDTSMDVENEDLLEFDVK